MNNKLSQLEYELNKTLLNLTLDMDYSKEYLESFKNTLPTLQLDKNIISILELIIETKLSIKEIK